MCLPINIAAQELTERCAIYQTTISNITIKNICTGIDDYVNQNSSLFGIVLIILIIFIIISCVAIVLYYNISVIFMIYNIIYI